MLFNRDVSALTNYESSDIDTEAKTDELLCDIQRTAETNMLEGTGYTENTTTANGDGVRMLQPPQPSGPSQLTTASGVAISGAMIFNALASGNMDAVENEWVTLDECISHPTPYGEYHYHMWSPCA